jgi:hypothetical protein
MAKNSGGLKMKQTAFRLFVLVPLISTTFVFSGASLAQDVNPTNQDISSQRFAIGGKKSTLNQFYGLNLDCTSVWQDVKISKSPENGEARLKEGTTIVSYSAPNARVRCNGKSTKAMALEYTPTKGYMGKDSIEIELVNEVGQRIVYSYDITVK